MVAAWRGLQGLPLSIWGTSGVKKPAETSRFEKGDYKNRAHLDISKVYDLLAGLPKAVTFFGGARIKEDDPYYDLSMKIGEALAKAKVPPRTGAGPGIMGSVPAGFQIGRAKLTPDDSLDLRTQGVGIEVPFEDDVAPSIEVHDTISLFNYRKAGLFDHVQGLVSFPGGFGTLDELFEVWGSSADNLKTKPLVAVGHEFWQPILDSIEQVALKDRTLISEGDFNRLFVSDDPEAIIDHLDLTPDPEVGGMGCIKGAEDIRQEMERTTDVLANLPEAVTVIGANSLDRNDASLWSLSKLLGDLNSRSIPVRIGNDQDPIAKTVASRSHDIQAMLLDKNDNELSRGNHLEGAQVERVSYPVHHSALLTENCKALVALPGDLGTLDKVFTVLTQIQCKKMDPIPVILVGTAYWQPIFDAIKNQMALGERQTISPEDLDLVTITDDPRLNLFI